MEIYNKTIGEHAISDGNAEEEKMNNVYHEMIDVFNRINYTVVRVSLLNNRVCILQCMGRQEAIGKMFDWTEYLEKSSSIFFEEDQKNILENLSAARLLELYRSGEEYYSLHASYMKDERLSSMKITVFFVPGEEPLAYVTVRNSFKEYLRKRIVDMYVCDHCDFLICIDARNRSYIVFDSQSSVSYAVRNDYTLGIQEYVEQNIASEDKKTVLRELEIGEILKNLESEKEHSFTCGVIDSDGAYRRKRFEYRYYEKSIQILLLSCVDITEIYREEQERRKALFNALKSAQTDMLTGLLNYKGIVENVTECLQKGVRHGALLFMDLDNFKSVNDTYGHDVGDDVLSQFAYILHEEATSESFEALVGRFGGDEFVIFFPEVKTMDKIKECAYRISSDIAKLEYGNPSDDVRVSCSIGIAELPTDGEDYEALLKKADERLYYAKKSGKNRVVFDEEREEKSC